MRLRAGAADDFMYLDSLDNKGVRNQRSMTAPRNCFSAHYSRRLATGELDETLQMFGKRCRLHVVGIASEAGVAPPRVKGVRLRASQASQSRHVPVVNSRVVQRPRQSLSIELRIVARSRDGAGVDDAPNAVRPEEADQFRGWARGMSDREDDQRHLAGRNVPGASSFSRT